MSVNSDIQEAIRRISTAPHISILSGAGISAESGVPTFRGQGGLWENHRPEELATPQAFARDPELVWRWYHWRRELIAKCRPNPAHTALVDLESNKPGFKLISQNVDGLHRRAGTQSLLEIHGNLWFLRCTRCGRRGLDERLDLPTPPLCDRCGGVLRPDVVWFGESLDAELLQQSWEAAQDCQVMLVVGTSAVVQPAAGLAHAAKQAGAFVIEVNLEPTPNSEWVDLSLLGKAGRILPLIVQG